MEQKTVMLGKNSLLLLNHIRVTCEDISVSGFSIEQEDRQIFY